MADTFQPIGTAAVNVLAQVPLRPRYSGVALVLARRFARNAVEHQLRGEGVRVSLVRPAEISARAQVYLQEHRELLDQCAEIVQRDPKLRAIAEQAERQRERQWRKWQRKSGLLDRQSTTPTSAGAALGTKIAMGMSLP
jgi:hypothetical protein